MSPTEQHDSRDRQLAHTPDVTVIVGAYNSMPYVTACVKSALTQSIGQDRLEVIAVDDGSTDGTGPELDRLAAGSPAIRVVHQANSGGPAGPRNRGIDLARGRYLFFLDADDYLGPEALERMVAMADRNHSDVVVGRRVGVGGRKPQETMLRHDIDEADLYTSGVWWTLSAQKLFRRSFVDRHSLRFPNLPLGQDQPFGGMAYLRADVISVLASYDCYFLVRRDDGGNNTTVQRDIDAAIESVETMMRMVADHVEPGERRDALMQRHFAVDLSTVCFTHRFLGADPEARRAAVARTQGLIKSYYTARVAEKIPVKARLKYALIERGEVEKLADLVGNGGKDGRGKELVEGGRVYAGHPYFRDPAMGIPDAVYDVTDQLKVRQELTTVRWDGGSLRVKGYAFINGVDTTEADSELVLRDDRATEYRIPTSQFRTTHLTKRFGKGVNNYDNAGYEAVVDSATAAGGEPLPDGRWEIWLRVRYQGIVRQLPISRPPGASAPAETTVAPSPPAPAPRVTTLRTTEAGSLVLEVAMQASVPHVSVEHIRWGQAGPMALTASGESSGGEVELVLSRSGTKSYRFPAQPTGPSRYVIDVPLATAAGGRQIPNGLWQVSIEMTAGDVRYRAPVPKGVTLERRLWWRRRMLVTGRVRRDGAFELTLNSPLSADNARRTLRVLRRRLRPGRS